MNDIVCVATFSNRLEANIAKGKLEANGIKSFVTADDEGSMLPFSLGKRGVQLFVKSGHFKEAQKILRSKNS